MIRSVLLFVLACVMIGTGGCAGLQNIAPYPSARVTDAAMGDLGLTSVTVDFKIEVENPYTVALPVVGLDFALSTEGVRFLEGALEASRMIPAGMTETLDMPIKIPFLELYDVVSKAESGGTIPYKADFGLTVDAPVLGAVKLPMDATGELKIPSFP